MKKKELTRTLLMAAALMAGVACERETVKDSPLYDAETKEVTTQFMLSVATNSPQTRQTSANVQQASNFLGINNAVMYVYSTSGIPAGETPYVNKTTAPAEGTFKRFDLGTVYSDGAITANANYASSSRRLLNLTIPVGTDAVLFYGKAIRPSNQGSAAAIAHGATIHSYSATPANTEFKVTKIFESDEIVNQYDATARLMIFVINQILATKLNGSDSYLGYENLPPISWEDQGHQYEINTRGAQSRYSGTYKELCGLAEVLGSAYFNFTYIKDGEYRAGSSNAVKGMIMDMYRVISAAAASEPTNAEEANAKRLAAQVLRTAGTYISANTGRYEEISDIKTLICQTQNLMSSDAFDAQFGGAQDLNDYPYGDFHIPEGAAQLEFHPKGAAKPKANPEDATEYYAADEFAYMHPNKPLVNRAAGTFEPRKYVYPAELMYYVNSSIRTSSKEDLSENDYLNGAGPWVNGTWGSDWISPGKVISSTRGVAVKNNINYGVALLKTNVVYGSSTLNDNRASMTGGTEGDRTITAATSGIELRGILVGGVNPRYNWQFLRKYTDPTHEFSPFDGVIYDTDLMSTAIGAAVNSYTLVYDNYDSDNQYKEGEQTVTGQRPVFVALEFVNNGEAFWGKDNLIAKGSVFYLVGKLTTKAYDSENPDPDGVANARGTITWPTDHEVPPIWGMDGETGVPAGKYGKSKQIPRVFIQDFMTSATFKIGENSLKNAYYTVPDLRASQMSLGLSVDLAWETGYSYELTF